MELAQRPYVSRGSEAAFFTRREPVLWPGMAHLGALSDEQLATFERDGFLLIDNVFDADELAWLQSRLDGTLAAFAGSPRPEAITEPGSGAVRSVFDVGRHTDAFAALAREPRLIDVARQILGSEVYLHQSRVNFKPGFRGKDFYWHSDFETWHIEDGMPQMRALSCSVLLTDNHACNGPLMLIPGSHRRFVSCVGATPDQHYQASLKQQDFGVPDEFSLKMLVDDLGLAMPTAKAGSVLFFDCNVLHGSGSNISPYPRSNVFFVYNSVENTLQAPSGGLTPRPDYIANRSNFTALVPQPLRR
ncbi:ectoine hydroxylase [Chitinibacteraceae bacterium HSL-7]